MKLSKVSNFNEVMSFNKLNNRGKFIVSELPSFARICFNVIILENNHSKKNMREGYIFGSVSTSIFTFNRILKNGEY